MIIQKASDSQANDLALLHQRELSASFLSCLGVSFLEVLYGSLIQSEKSFCLVVEDHDDGVVGFACGCVNTGKFYKEFIKANLLSTAIAIFPSVLRPSVIRGIYENLRYARGTTDKSDLPSAELISLVVLKESRGQGLAGDLLIETAREFASRDIVKFKVIAGSSLSAANAFYGKMGLELVGGTEIHSGEVSNIYLADTKKLTLGSPVKKRHL